MTTDTRPETAAGIDYAAIESAIGLNRYDADPNLQQLVERLAAPGDRAFAAAKLAERPLRGITSGDRTALDFFEPIVRYAPVAPSDVLA